MTNVPVIKFMFRSEWKPLTEALLISPGYELDEFHSANDLTTFLSGASAGMIVVSLRDKNDLVQLATLVKLIKKIAAKPTFVKVIVVNFSGNKQFERAVAKLDLDLLEEKIQTKALRFKIDFMMKSINAQLKKNANVVSNSLKTLESGKAQDKKTVESKALFVAQLECEDDMWLLRTEADCKTVLTRWLVRLIGPSPYVATWVDSGTPGIWKFEFKNKNSDFVYGSGSWFYRGDQKPDFIWAENIWSFTGNSFDLFYKDGNDIFSRLRLKDKQLTIAKNSEYARMKEKDIIESFDKDLVFRKELQATAEKDAFDAEELKLQNLEGKAKTDTLNHGPLSGQGKTDALYQAPLSGKGNTSHLNVDPLSMDLKPGENSGSTDPLSQKTATSKTSSFWNGKNTKEEEGKGPMDAPADQDIRSGEQLGLKTKKTHETFYKNHNEAEQFEAKEKEAHAYKKAGVSENLNGKIDPSKTASDAASDLSGKSSTDKVNAHLTSPNARKEKSAGEKTENEYSGKSSTDKIDGHLSSENAKRDQNEASGSSNAERAERAAKTERESKGSTAQDKLGGGITSQGASNGKSATTEKEFSDKEINEIQKEKNSSGGKTKNDQAPDDTASSEKMANYLAALKAKKEKMQKEQEGFVAALSDAKTLGRANESREDKTPTTNYAKNPGTKDDTKGGNVLPFAAKANNQPAEEAGLGSKELEDAVQTAKVTSQLTQGSIKVLGNLDDYFDQTIIFNTAQPGILANKTVSLNLNFNYMNKETNLNLEGKVSQITPDEEGSQYITVVVSAENATAFNSFMKIYNTRQENINAFFKAVKGY